MRLNETNGIVYTFLTLFNVSCRNRRQLGPQICFCIQHVALSLVTRPLETLPVHWGANDSERDKHLSVMMKTPQGGPHFENRLPRC